LTTKGVRIAWPTTDQ